MSFFLKSLSSSRKEIFIYVFFGIISAIALFPFLFDGKMMLSSDSDALYYYYPTFSFYSKALQAGESFLWNPLLLSGFPSYLSQSAGFFDPINLFIAKYFFDPILGYNFRLFLDFLSVLIFSYLAGRSFRISRAASIFIGPSYLLAFHWRFLSNLVIANSLFVLPLIFYVFNRSLNSQKWWLWSLFGGFGIGWAFLGGYAQFNIYAIFLLCLYAIIQFLYIDKRAMTPEEIARFFMPLVSMIIIGGIISLPQILPALKFTPLTIRAGGLDYSATTLKVVEPGDFSLFLFPDYLYFPYLSSGRKSLYIGAFWFFLSVAVFFIGLDKIRKKDINHKLKILIALFSLFIFSLIASLKWSPIFYLMNKLPVFEYFRFPYRWMYLGIWFLSVIGALGFDFIKDYSNDAYLRRVFRIIGILIGAIFTSVIFLNFGGNIFWDNAVRLIDFIFSLVLYGKFGLDKNPAHYLDAIKRGISAWQEFLSLYEISFLVPFSVLVSGFLLISAFIWNKLAWYKFRILGMFLSLATFLFIFAGQWSNSVDGGKIFNYRNMLEKFINPDNLLLYRTYPFMLDYGFSKIVPPKYAISKNELSALTDLQFTSGWPNMGFYSGIQSVDGYEPFTTKDLFSALGKIGSTHGGEEYTKKLSVDKKIARFLSSLEVIGMMSGKYVISGVELSHERLRLIGKEYVTEYKIPLFLYENNLAMPKFYFAKKTVLSPGKSLADLVDMANRDFGNNTYLDCSDCNLDSSIGDFEVLSYKNGQIKIRTSTNALGWFIFSESFLPGWIALIDGLPVTIMRVNGLYMGINIPTGQHDLEFSYNGILGEGKFLKYLRITN